MSRVWAALRFKSFSGLGFGVLGFEFSGHEIRSSVLVILDYRGFHMFVPSPNSCKNEPPRSTPDCPSLDPCRLTPPKP